MGETGSSARWGQACALGCGATGNWSSVLGKDKLGSMFGLETSSPKPGFEGVGGSPELARR